MINVSQTDKLHAWTSSVQRQFNNENMKVLIFFCGFHYNDEVKWNMWLEFEAKPCFCSMNRAYNIQCQTIIFAFLQLYKFKQFL